MTHESFDELVAGLGICCDGSNEQGRDCANAPQWYVTFHDCNAEILCEECTRYIIVDVLATVHHHGRVGCSKCGNWWAEASGFLTVRAL